MRILTFLLLLTAANAYATDEIDVTPAQWCAEQLEASSFNTKQRQAIAAAAVDGYSIRRFTVELDGQPRVVTVIGESLIKSKATAVNGARLASTFDVVARSGITYYQKSWFPKVFLSYLKRRLDAERADAKAEHFGSIADLLNEDDAVRRYEDEVVAKLIARRAANPRFSPKDVRLSVNSIQLGSALIGFDHEDVVRRILAKQVERPERKSIAFDEGYRPTLKHNLAMLFVVSADKLGFLAGRAQRIVSALALAGGIGWMAVTNGHDGGWFTLGSAGVLALQTAIDVGRRNMTPEFVGISPLSYHLSNALVGLLGETDPKDEVVLVVGEMQAQRVDLRLRERGFRREVHIPSLDDGRLLIKTR